MPLYEYQCKKCEKKFEILVNRSDVGNPVECPHCNSKETDKLLSTFCPSVGSGSSGETATPCSKAPGGL